tara:strand:- start:20224 stop:21003 length:780 start_codon:yes stop_codon:yes gene_type:complete
VNPSNLPIPSDQPADSSATSSEGVIIGAGDIVQMSMFGQADMNIQGFVSDTGQISLPLLGIVNIGDLTPNAAQTRIETAYREGGYFRDPQISLTLVEHRSQQVSVLGAVNQPGRFSLTSRTTLLDVLAEAGGITARGARSVVLIHAGKDAEMRERIDIDALVAGDSTASVLRAGDTVYVPEAPLFYIYGQVQRPDAYAIRPGMTVIQAISTGGGLTDRGSNSRFAIHRRAPDGTVKTLDGSPTTRVQAGDVIFVKERFF